MTEIDISVAGLTVREVVPEIPPDVAIIVVVPGVAEVALPLVPAALLMVATDATDELHVAVAVRSCVEESEKVPAALNCWFVPGAIRGFVGVTVIETRVIGAVPPPPPPPPPQPASSTNSKRMMRLFDFIDCNPRWDHVRQIGPSLQIAHVPPFFNNYITRGEFLSFTSECALTLFLYVHVFIPICPEDLHKVGMYKTVPSYAEDNPGR